MYFGSKIEEKVFDALQAADFLGGFSIEHQKSWTDLFNTKSLNAVDYFLKELEIIVEVQGEQHYKPTSFGETDSTKILESFKKQRKRDRKLQNLCEDFNYSLIEVPYQLIRSSSIEELADWLDSKALSILEKK